MKDVERREVGVVDWVESVLAGLRVVRRAPTPEPTYVFALWLWIR